MTSNVVTVVSDGTGIAEALAEAEKTAVYCSLGHKQTLQLRLLAEELTGMIRSIVGFAEAKFWI